MPRSLLILIVLVVLALAILLGLAALDRPVPVTHVEQPVTANASAH